MNLSHLSIRALRRELLREAPSPTGTQQHTCAEAGGLPYAANWPPGSLLNYRLAVAKEILLRGAYADAIGTDYIGSPIAAMDYFRLHVADLQREVFLVAYLDTRNRIIAIEEAFDGTLTATSVYPRELVRAALQHGAAAVIACHNHPSGTPDASRADEVLTLATKQALATVDVRFLDHLIYADGNFLSLAERGLI